MDQKEFNEISIVSSETLSETGPWLPAHLSPAGQTLSLEANQRLTAFERVGMEDYLFKLHKLTQDLIDVKVHTTVEKWVYHNTIVL